MVGDSNQPLRRENDSVWPHRYTINAQIELLIGAAFLAASAVFKLSEYFAKWSGRTQSGHSIISDSDFQES